MAAQFQMAATDMLRKSDGCPMTPAERQARRRANLLAEIERLRDALRRVLATRQIAEAHAAAREALPAMPEQTP
jgi:hypothetical protein